jgi:hypothetical protein
VLGSYSYRLRRLRRSVGIFAIGGIPSSVRTVLVPFFTRIPVGPSIFRASLGPSGIGIKYISRIGSPCSSYIL